MNIGVVDVIELGEGVGDGECVDVGDGEGLGFFIATPLSQINFFPDLIQVNL